MGQQYDATTDPHQLNIGASTVETHIGESPVCGSGATAAQGEPESALTLTGAPLIWTLAPDGALQDVSAEWRAYTGQLREQISGLATFDAIHPNDRDTTLATIQRALAERRPCQTQCRVRRWDGAYQPFFLAAIPLSADDGCVRQWAIMLTNVTEHDEMLRGRAPSQRRDVVLGQASARAAHLAQIADDRFQRLVDANVIGVFLVNQGHITEANDAFLDLVGYTRADLDAGRIRWHEMTPPEYRPLGERGIAELLERGECAPYEKEYVRKDGRRVPILIGSTLLAHEPPQWVSFVVDLSERKRLEQESGERARTLEVIFETMLDGIVLLGPAGEVRMMNSGARRLLALDDAELSQPLAQRGLTLALRHPITQEPLPQAEWPSSRILRGEALTGLVSVDMLARTHGGREALINCAGAPVHDEQGHIAGAVLLVRDVGERRRLEREVAERAAELEVMNQRLDEFLHIVAHELRTPLTSLMLTLQLVERRLLCAPPTERAGPRAESGACEPAPTATPSVDVTVAARELLAQAQQQVGRLARLLDDLTDASRVRTGKLTLHPAPCDLAALVRDVVEEMRQVTKRAIHLQTLAIGAAPVVVDADRIKQVFINYLTNAAKYSPSDTPITVSLTVEAAQARVAVRDHGPGLTPEQQERIWERFHQVGGVQAEGAANASAGLGLGLHISRSLIEAHGGAVGVESAGNRGSTFWFSLPLRADPHQASSRASTPTT